MERILIYSFSLLLLQVVACAQQPKNSSVANRASALLKGISTTIENAFVHLPSGARPLVDWFWMGSNFS